MGLFCTQLQILLYYDELVIKLNDMFNKFCPMSRKKINKNSINNPWLTSKLKNAIRKKKLFNTYKTKNCPITFIKYKKLKNKINKNIKYKKKNITQIFFQIVIKKKIGHI